jgi:hypothetical protein
MENHKAEIGNWKMENRNWKLENGIWNMENGKSEFPRSHWKSDRLHLISTLNSYDGVQLRHESLEHWLFLGASGPLGLLTSA